MAEPRKVPFVTISSFNTSPPTPESSKKRRREDEAVDITFGKDGGGSAAAVGSGGGGDPFGNTKGADAETREAKPTVRLNLPLTEPNERASAEFNYGELVNSTLTQVRTEGTHRRHHGVHRRGLTWHQCQEGCTAECVRLRCHSETCCYSLKSAHVELILH